MGIGVHCELLSDQKWAGAVNTVWVGRSLVHCSFNTTLTHRTGCCCINISECSVRRVFAVPFHPLLSRMIGDAVHPVVQGRRFKACDQQARLRFPSEGGYDVEAVLLGSSHYLLSAGC